jgi:PAS domain S-box-containing protein
MGSKGASMMQETTHLIARLLEEHGILRQYVAALEMELAIQHATLAECQDTMEEQGLVEHELRQKLAEREAVQQALAVECAQYQTLFELAPDGYLVTNAAGIIDQANSAAARLLGRPQLVSLPLAGFVAPEAVQTFMTLLRSLRTASQPQTCEMSFAPPKTAPFVGELSVTVREGAQPVDTRYHWLLRDITARKEVEAALRHAMAERQRLEREAQRATHFALLGRLAAGVSHEIRNPLAAIVLYTDLLEEALQQPSPENPQEIAESLSEIKTNLVRLDDLMQDYLSLARVAALELTPQDVGAAVQAWAQEWQGLADARGVTLRLEGLPELTSVAVHASSLRRALLNLVQNALDAMPEGGTLTLAGQSTATHVQLQVRDTGKGMPADQLTQVFEPLYTTKDGGTGLGLYIVQEVIAAHGAA